MNMTMVSTNGSHPTPPASVRNLSPRSTGVRPTLPDKRVTSDNIEDAYVNFIMHCNPAVPMETETVALREAFRVPPKSGGKAFSTFILFELIKKLEEKELKTWAELALKLGVEPPDQDKGQSSQKIQQYAVRLKRWMHSMHINAFFDYLQDNPHPYWTQIPTDPNPVCEDGRDGVAAEDDMALRALLPHIKPRRGRRKPEDDLSRSPSQRPRLDSPPLNGGARTADPWTAGPEARAFLFPSADQARATVIPGHASAFPWGGDISQTPLEAYPQSAVTPSVRQGSYWPDPTEPQSAITPSKPRPFNRRHGAKVVSSAWRSGATPGASKTRGRPPNSKLLDTPLSAFPDNAKSFNTIPLETIKDTPPPTSMAASSPEPVVAPPPPPPSSQPTSATTPTTKLMRPGRLSLQVPQRVGGAVRLATPPPPAVVINGEPPSSTGDMSSQPQSAVGSSALNALEQPAQIYDEPTPINGTLPNQVSNNVTESKSNAEDIESLLAYELLAADWYDGKGSQVEAGSVDEVLALVKTIIENISKQALTKDMFLMQLAALAGGGLIMKTGNMSVTRVQDNANQNTYSSSWKLQYGTVKAEFSRSDTVPHHKWKKDNSDQNVADNGSAGQTGSSAQYWRKKYVDLLQYTQSRNKQATDFRVKVLESLKNSEAGRQVP